MALPVPVTFLPGQNMRLKFFYIWASGLKSTVLVIRHLQLLWKDDASVIRYFSYCQQMPF